jgi:prophage regulatory protein
MRILTTRDLRELKGIRYHKNHLRKMWRRGDFPKPFQLSTNRLGWTEETIDAWIAERQKAYEVA